MRRCDKPAGEFEVTFEYLTKPYGIGERPDEFLADIGDHESVYDMVDGGAKLLVETPPKVSQHHPYIGELCECEVEWLSYLPGFMYARHRRYHVKKLEGVV